MYARHNWGRARESLISRRFLHVQIAFPEDADDEVIVEEWTDPADISKALFFWNLNGVITASQDMSLTERQGIVEVVFGSWWLPFQLFVMFWELDNWPILFRFNHSTGIYFTNSICNRLEMLAEYLTTFIVLFTATLLSKILGVRAVSQKRTPEGLWNAYQKRSQ
jgi:hypothetical protein